VGARRNIPTKKQRQRQHAVAAGREPPSQAEVRFSARRTAQVANYNDEEDEDEFVEDDDEITANYWANAVEENGPVIDKVLDHRPKEGIGTLHVRSFVVTCLRIAELEDGNALKAEFDYLVSAINGRGPLAVLTRFF
jgi:hypothetical protein